MFVCLGVSCVVEWLYVCLISVTLIGRGRACLNIICILDAIYIDVYIIYDIKLCLMRTTERCHRVGSKIQNDTCISQTMQLTILL